MAQRYFYTVAFYNTVVSCATHVSANQTTENKKPKNEMRNKQTYMHACILYRIFRLLRHTP